VSKVRGRDYRLSPISNSDIKKAAAAKHNRGYVEAQAYAQDRIEDPDKYKRNISIAARRKPSAELVMAIGAGYLPYYID